MKIEPVRKQIVSFSVSGITVRTLNSDEIHPDTAKLSKHWNTFFSQRLTDKIPYRLMENKAIYGVYSHYDSDWHGYYDLTAGVAVSHKDKQAIFDTIHIHAGHYLVFEHKGIMPEAVLDTWKAIWLYFQNNPHIERNYKTDFEAYYGADEVAVHIGIK